MGTGDRHHERPGDMQTPWKAGGQTPWKAGGQGIDTMEGWGTGDRHHGRLGDRG